MSRRRNQDCLRMFVSILLSFFQNSRFLQHTKINKSITPIEPRTHTAHTHDNKYQPFGFSSRCLIFLFPYSCLAVQPTALASGNRWSQISNGTSIRWAGTIHFTSYTHNFAFFSTLPDGVENTYSQFSLKHFNEFVNCLRILLKVLEFHKSARHDLHSLHFPGGKCVTWENRKRHGIHPTPFNQFPSSFHQNDRTVTGHLIF